MKLSPDLYPLSISYPDRKNLPKNYIKSKGKNFQSIGPKKSFKERFNNEDKPHTIKHIHYQYGTIPMNEKGKMEDIPAIRFFYHNHPRRIVIEDSSDIVMDELKSTHNSNVAPPPFAASSIIARVLRERALKWISDQFFTSIGYITYDEPIIDGVNPDLLSLPNIEASKVLQMHNNPAKFKPIKKIGESEKINPNPLLDGLVDITFKNACFVELKAYHKSTVVGEKEVLQAFNYSVRGGKSLLITSGHYGDLDTFKILNDGSDQHHKAKPGYDPEVFENFVNAVKAKFKKLIKKLDLRKGQDMYDNKFIYYFNYQKLKKYMKYTTVWPKKIKYIKINTSTDLLTFLTSSDKLGLVTPEAFNQALIDQNLQEASSLFQSLRKSLLEEIMINPTILYP